MRRCSTRTSTPPGPSYSTRSSRRMWPRAGVSRPAIALASVLLPAPDGPNSAVTPGVGDANRAVSWNVPRRSVRSTSSTALLAETRPQAAGDEFGDDESGEPEPERQCCQTRGGQVAARRLQRGVEREWQGLRLARDVAREGDHRAELAESRGEGGDGPGENSRRHQWQGDGREAVERAGAERACRILEAGRDRLQRQANRTDHQRQAHDRGREGSAGGRECKPQAERSVEPAADRSV